MFKFKVFLTMRFLTSFCRASFSLLLLLSLSSCYSLREARTPQQKFLTPDSLKFFATPIDDNAEETIDDDYIDDNAHKEQIISQNFYKTISIAVNENMKMREVLTKMAVLANVNVFIANDIDGSISFNAVNRKFIDILNDICTTAELKYEINDNSVKIEHDSPMTKVYNVQFLNITREVKNSVGITTDIFSQQLIDTKNGSSDNMNNGSNSNVLGIGKSDFWGELDSALKSIISESEGETVAFHKQAGLVTVYTTHKKHRDIRKYIDMLKDTSEAQVLIEAKILEVELKDEYRSGINWDIARPGNAVYSSPGFNESSFNDTKAGFFSFGNKTPARAIIAGFIEKFGAVKTLSSPRITILNNQSAILKVAQNEVIYLPELQRQFASSNDGRNSDMVSTSIKTIPIGLVMSVQPSIDKKHNTVILTLRPTVSRVVKYQEVPFFYPAIATVNGGNSEQKPQPTGQAAVHMQKIPIVDVREFDSVLRLQSGQAIVMGGLMSEKSNNERSGLPGTKGLPMDFLANNSNKSTHVTELVVFLRASIIRKKNKLIHTADEKIYDRFASDPRPLRFKK